MTTSRFNFYQLISINYQLLFLIFLASCSSNPAEQPHAGKKSESSSIGIPTMTGFNLKHYEGAYLAYSLKANVAEIYEKEDRADVVAPNLVIHEREPQASTHATPKVKMQIVKGPVKIEAVGDTGEVNLATKDILLVGNVVYKVKPKQYVLKTSKLYYWSSRGETEVPEGTGYTLTTPTGVMEGSGMVSKEDLE